MTWVDGMSEEQVAEFKAVLETTLDCAQRMRDLGTALSTQPPGDPDAGNDLWAAANHLMDGAVLLFVGLTQMNERRGEPAEVTE